MTTAEVRARPSANIRAKKADAENKDSKQRFVNCNLRVDEALRCRRRISLVKIGLPRNPGGHNDYKDCGAL